MGKAYSDGVFGIFWSGIKIRKKPKSEKEKKIENEECEEENEEEEDDEDSNNKFGDKNKRKKFVGKKYELNELQQLNFNN
jgi:hypothetical protein